MGVKGISWIEANVEKIVAGVFGVGLLGVIAMQFVGGSTTIKLTGLDTKPQDVPIESAMDRIGQRARTVHEKITAPDPLELVTIQEKLPGTAGVQEDFAKRLGNVAPHQRLASVMGTPRFRLSDSAPSTGPNRGSQSFMYAAIAPAAPEKPVGATYLGTIHPVEYANTPDVAKILPADPLPKDKAAISIESAFDGVALATILSTDPDGDGPMSALPSHWWNSDNTQVLAVNLERQELLPSGEWSDAKPVAPMPGRPNLISEMDKVAAGGGDAMKTLMANAKLQAESIRKPKYYEVVYGENWLLPSEAAVLLTSSEGADGAPADDMTKAKKELSDWDTQIAKLQEQIRKIEEEKPEGERTPPNAPPPPGGKGAGDPTRPPRSPSPADDPKNKRLKPLQDRLATLLKRRETIIEKWSKRGVELEPEKNVDPNRAPTTPANDPTKTAAPELPLLDNNAAKLLAHDVFVQRGKTYRYRVSLTLNNPIYGKVVANNPEQEKLQKEPFVHTAPSEWSDPVSVEDETYYFVTSASSQDAISRSSRATADVYIFRWGFWRRGTVSIEPGDIIATDVKIPDFSKQIAMLAPPPAPDQPGANPNPNRNAPPPPFALPPGPGRDGQPVNPDGMAEKVEVAYKQESVSHDAVMLQVASTAVLPDPSSSKSRLENQVFLRESDGSLVVRSPESDRMNVMFRRLASSAQRGDEALRPKAVIPDGPAGPVTPPGKGDPQPPSGGGGG